MVGIHPITLLRWLYAGEVAEPPIRPGGGQKTRLWTARDLARVKKHKAKNYRKGRKLMRKKH
jgi:hypothetical protein